ncbi:heavy metal transporter [Actinocorallia aurea]
MRWRALAGLLAVGLVAAIGYGGYRLFSAAHKVLLSDGCRITSPKGEIQLSLSQAANAATIAGVAHRKDLPKRAVVIAYATAEQESHIENLAYGDRDSVGIFQQRPSQGWGDADQLQDPVYASGKFYDALVKVRGYAEKDLHEAAQEVQRSFDGSLYAQHERMAEILAAGFTGGPDAEVTCWYRPGDGVRPDPAKAFAELRRTFGKDLKAEGDAVTVPDAEAATGKSLAAWAVAHAETYGLTEVRHAGLTWTAATGHDGWTKDAKSPKDRVLIR